MARTSSVSGLRFHRDYLDGLRALAALWVVLSHLWILQFGLSAHRGIVGLATNWTLYSHLAVDLFIVLSGYCLILPVVRDRSFKGGALAFFKRRALRILPPFYASLILSVFVGLALQISAHHPLHFNWTALFANLFLVQDIFLNLDIFNGPFWSIAVEWRIYFLFPLVVWTVLHWGRTAALIWTGLASICGTIMLFHFQPQMLLASPWYLFLFTLGVCAGATPFREDSRDAGLWTWFCGLSVLVLAALLTAFPVTVQGGADFGQHMPLIDTAAGAAVASFLILLGNPTGSGAGIRGARAFLSYRPLVFLGSFAYSVYLIHMPCLLTLNAMINSAYLASLSSGWKVVLRVAFGLPFIILASYFFFLACELPFLRRRNPANPAAIAGNVL